MQVLLCQHECVRELATRPGRLSPIDNFLPLHYDFLQFAYYKGKPWFLCSLALITSSLRTAWVAAAALKASLQSPELGPLSLAGLSPLWHQQYHQAVPVQILEERQTRQQSFDHELLVCVRIWACKNCPTKAHSPYQVASIKGMYLWSTVPPPCAQSSLPPTTAIIFQSSWKQESRARLAFQGEGASLLRDLLVQRLAWP